MKCGVALSSSYFYSNDFFLTQCKGRRGGYIDYHKINISYFLTFHTMKNGIIILNLPLFNSFGSHTLRICRLWYTVFFLRRCIKTHLHWEDCDPTLHTSKSMAAETLTQQSLLSRYQVSCLLQAQHTAKGREVTSVVMSMDILMSWCFDVLTYRHTDVLMFWCLDIQTSICLW